LQPDHSSFRELLEIELDRFDLSVRARNCLINQRVQTVGQLSDLTTADIRAWRNAGRKTLLELQELLGSVGLRLKDDPEPIGTFKPGLLEELKAAAPLSTKAGSIPRPTIFLEQAAPDMQKRLITHLKLFSLSTRARNVLVQQKLRYLGEIVRLKHSDLCALPHSGRRTADELIRLMQQEGFSPGTAIPDWSRELAATLERQFRGEIEIETVKRSSDHLAAIGPEPTCIEDELSRIATALATGRNLDVVMKLWGWTGSEPRTLESVAQEQKPRLTRERIRQIESTALRKLQQFRFDTPYLRSTLVLLRKEVPALTSSLNSKLREHGLSRRDFLVASVKVAAQIIKLNWPFTEVAVGSERILVLSDDENRVVRITQVARRRTSELGCLSMISLLSELGIPETKIDNIRAIIDVLPSVQWLDDDKTWLHVPESRNRLLNLAAKVLGVCPRIRLPELRRAVAKSRRLSMAPPQKILGAFVQQIGVGKADGDMITANPSMVIVPKRETVEGKMLAVLDEHGPVMSGEDFADKCVAAGVNPISFYIYRVISPVVAALGNNIYCKVGAEVPVGLVEEIRAHRKTTARISDHGWMPNGNIWFGFKISRSVITTGSVLLNSFVSDLVQGEWQVRLPDGGTYDCVTCRDVFITSFRKAFSALGVEPDDFVALEFDHRAKTVLARAGGPDLFESMLEASPSELACEEDADTEDYSEAQTNGVSRSDHTPANGL
jgi:hypothetical protein